MVNILNKQETKKSRKKEVRKEVSGKENKKKVTFEDRTGVWREFGGQSGGYFGE